MKLSPALIREREEALAGMRARAAANRDALLLRIVSSVRSIKYQEKRINLWGDPLWEPPVTRKDPRPESNEFLRMGRVASDHSRSATTHSPKRKSRAWTSR